MQGEIYKDVNCSIVTNYKNLANTQMPIDREWLNTATVLMEGGNNMGHFGCNYSRLGEGDYGPLVD